MGSTYSNKSLRMPNSWNNALLNITSWVSRKDYWVKTYDERNNSCPNGKWNLHVGSANNRKLCRMQHTSSTQWTNSSLLQSHYAHWWWRSDHGYRRLLVILRTQEVLGFQHSTVCCLRRRVLSLNQGTSRQNRRHFLRESSANPNLYLCPSFYHSW